MESLKNEGNMIKNVILDVGRVLVAWEPAEAMEQKLGMDKETVKKLCSVLFDSGAWNETDRGVMSNAELLQFFVSKAPECEKEITLFWNHVNAAICQFDYARGWISAMKEAGYGVYILSNYGDWTYQKTREEALNFVELVDGALFSYEVKLIKPDAAIYHALLERFDLKAEECVFLDDLPANIEAARKAGITGIVFEGLEKALESLKALGVEIAYNA